MQTERKRRWRWALTLLLLLLVSYGSYRLVRTPPELKKVRQLQTEMATAAAKNWTPEQRQSKFQEMRTAMEQLSPAQRDVLAAERQQQRQRDLERYAQLTPLEKAKYLDEQIDREQRMRQQFTALNANGAAAPRPPGPPPGSSPRGSNLSPQDREKRRKEMLDRTTPEYRALRDQFRKDMELRRQQRGLPPMNRPL